MIRIHQLTTQYHQLPSELLFPQLTSELAKLAIDNAVFEIGYREEIELEIKREESKIELENSRFEVMLKLLAAR